MNDDILGVWPLYIPLLALSNPNLSLLVLKCQMYLECNGAASALKSVNLNELHGVEATPKRISPPLANKHWRLNP